MQLSREVEWTSKSGTAFWKTDCMFVNAASRQRRVLKFGYMVPSNFALVFAAFFGTDAVQRTACGNTASISATGFWWLKMRERCMKNGSNTTHRITPRTVIFLIETSLQLESLSCDIFQTISMISQQHYAVEGRGNVQDQHLSTYLFLPTRKKRWEQYVWVFQFAFLLFNCLLRKKTDIVGGKA